MDGTDHMPPFQLYSHVLYCTAKRRKFTLTHTPDKHTTVFVKQTKRKTNRLTKKQSHTNTNETPTKKKNNNNKK